jgi:hypothetical protein
VNRTRYGEGPGRQPQANAVESTAGAAMSQTKFSTIYNPIRDQRRCARCGRRDTWRQLAAVGGGWSCCWPDAGAIDHTSLTHVCNARCAGEGRVA